MPTFGRERQGGAFVSLGVTFVSCLGLRVVLLWLSLLLISGVW